MNYIDENLMSGERVLHRGKLHWAVFLWPAFLFASAVLCFVTARESAGFGIFLVLLAVPTGIAALIRYATSEFGITNKRVIVKVGLISRKSLEVLLTKIEGIQVDQGILGRILGFGSITVSGTGGTRDPFHKISAPFEFRKKVQEQIAAVQDSRQ
jgi:uncharacterized membrane protein YdbT with pleckstrin-like domain